VEEGERKVEEGERKGLAIAMFVVP